MCTSLKVTKIHKDAASAVRDKKIAREVLLNMINVMNSSRSLSCTSTPKKRVVNL